MILNQEKIRRMMGANAGNAGGGGGGGFDPSALAGYATQEWTASNYISIEFFGRLFQAYNGNTAVNPNDTTTTIDNIKAMFGFWTEQYLSALGQGSGGGGGGQGDVTWALLVDNSDDRQIASSHITDLLGGTFSGKNYAVQRDANGKLYVNVPWENTTYTLAGLMGSTVKGSTTQPIYWNGSAFVNTSYTLGKSVPSDAKFTDTNTWRNIYTGGTSRVGTGTDTKALNFLAGSNIDIIYTAAGTGEGESGSADYFNIEIKAKNVYDSSISRTKNTVLAAPNGSNGAATFRALVAADIPSLAASKITSGTFDAARIPTLAISKISGLQDALDSKLDKSFFHNLFRAHKTVGGVDTVIPANGDLTDAESIEAMFGFWTEQYISSLGQGSGGGGGGQGDVTWTLLADNSDNRQIAVSHLTGLLNGSFSGKDYAVKKDANNKLYVNVPWENTTYTLAGLMGSTAKGSTTQPIYWNGSAFANTSYTLGKSVPSDAKFTDTTYSAGAGLSLNGTTFSVKTPSSGAWFGGTAFVASDGVMEIGRYIDFHPTSASTLDYNVRLDAGTGTTARIFTFPDSAGTLLSSGNSSVSKNGETLTVKINGTSQSLTNSTYSANNGVGLTGTTFYNSGVRAATINGNYLRVNTNGTNDDLTIPYATNADSAAKLTTVSKTAWGKTYWTANGVPDSISGDMSSVGDISFSASGKKIGGFLYFDTTNSRLGVGTNSPSYNLHIAGTGYFSDTLTIANNKGINMKDSSGDAQEVLNLNSSNQLILGGDTSNEGCNTYLRGYAVYLQYGGTNTGLIIDNSGNVGVGTTSPSYKLHVSGDIYATGGVTSLSDIRKKNVTSMVLPLSLVEIANAPTIKFTWRDEHDTDVHVGTIAQYWASVLPEVVKHRDGVMSMQYDVTALACAIIDAREIAALKREVVELKKELMKLKTA